MADAPVKRLSKPHWENIHMRRTYQAWGKSMVLGFLGSVLAYFFWYKPKWDAIEEYERNYDPFAEFERMRNLGIFSSCPPDYVIEERKKKEAAKKKGKK